MICQFTCQPSLAAGSPADTAAAEAAVRQADADWAAAAGTAGVDAWMAFYAADAIVLLPSDHPASGKEFIRHSVTRLLALSHLSLAWRAPKVDVAPSGDVAFLTETYELRFADPRAAPISDQGRRLEIWKRQADGAWKCAVDTWSSDEPAAPSAASPAGAQGTPAAGPAAVAVHTEPTPAAPAGSAPQIPVPAVDTKYGDRPADYKEAIQMFLAEHLKNPDSVQYREITQPERGYTTSISGGFLMSEKREYGWLVKATINAKNSHDRYVGFKTYTFLFRGEKIVDARLPLPEDEMN
jgi:ketosteroid isomerase-like protein